VLVALVAVSLAGCTAPSEAAPSSAAPAPPATPSGTPSGDADSADARLPEFMTVMTEVWDDSASVAGRDYIDALVDAGFSKDDMQVTFDETSIGDPADSIQFSVRIGEDCLVGQVGPSVDTPSALVMPGLEDGGCLVGQTRPIDW
jgi:hypothetical protein